MSGLAYMVAAAILAFNVFLVCLLRWMFREKRDFGWGQNRPVDEFSSDRATPREEGSE